MGLSVPHIVEEWIIERRVQLRGSSFVLTIPKKIVREMKLSKGQSVRFMVGDGEFTVRPTSVSAAKPNSADSSRYEEAIAGMMKNTGTEKPAGTRPYSEESKLGKIKQR